MSCDGSIPNLTEVLSPTAQGWRLKVITDPVWRLLKMVLLGAVLVPSLALPLLVPLLVLAYLLGSALLWDLVRVVLAVMGLVAVMTATWILVKAPGTVVQWIELQPGHEPPQIEIGSLLHRSTLTMDDLQYVVIQEQTKLGMRKSITISLETATRTVRCDPSQTSPLTRVQAQPLTDWLTGELTGFGVGVEFRTEAQMRFPPEEWLPSRRVATLWNVPLDAVGQTAALHGVESWIYAPRVVVVHYPHRAIVLYDPGMVYEVAKKLREQRTDPATEGTR